MLTNTYLPHVGGVANSVHSFTEALRGRGHHVMVVAPTYEGTPIGRDEGGVIRVPAIQKFNGSDFSYRLPAPILLSQAIDKFGPDLVHAHHPFLLGDTAMRIAASRGLPLVFTHHTMYEQYTHYVPGDSSPMQQFVIRMATDFANLCDHIIAPSQSIAEILRERGVVTPITPIPTGIDVERFARGSREAARTRWGVPRDAFVVGHVGRLAPEKNLACLSRAVARFVRGHGAARFLVIGGGPSEGDIRQAFEEAGVGDRLHMTGPLRGQELIDAYHAMDVFAFASQSETQGMVLAEAMAAGLPVVAVDACGVREVVRDGVNGRLLMREDEAHFADALAEVASLPPHRFAQLRDAARATAEEVSIARCTDCLLEVYGGVHRPAAERDTAAWSQALRLIEAEWNLWSTRATAAAEVVADTMADTFLKPSPSRTPPTPAQ